MQSREVGAKTAGTSLLIPVLRPHLVLVLEQDKNIFYCLQRTSALDLSVVDEDTFQPNVKPKKKKKKNIEIMTPMTLKRKLKLADWELK